MLRSKIYNFFKPKQNHQAIISTDPNILSSIFRKESKEISIITYWYINTATLLVDPQLHYLAVCWKKVSGVKIKGKFCLSSEISKRSTFPTEVAMYQGLNPSVDYNHTHVATPWQSTGLLVNLTIFLYSPVHIFYQLPYKRSILWQNFRFSLIIYSEIWIIFPDRWTAMHKSPPCKLTGGLKNK